MISKRQQAIREEHYLHLQRVECLIDCRYAGIEHHVFHAKSPDVPGGVPIFEVIEKNLCWRWKTPQGHYYTHHALARYSTRSCKLNTCESCGFRSTKQKVKYRNLTIYAIGKKWLELNPVPSPMLCWSCYNKRRPIIDRLNEARENQIAIRHIQEKVCQLRKQARQAQMELPTLPPSAQPANSEPTLPE